VIRLHVRDLVLNGSILANGGAGVGWAGGGSGGAIRIISRRVTGTGEVRAGGGDAVSISGGGGGGRIAISYEDEMSLPMVNLTVPGGTGFGSGNDGSMRVEESPYVQPSQALVFDPTFGSPRIEGIATWSTHSVQPALGGGKASADQLLIRWVGRPHTSYVPESSSDFSHWMPLHATITELDPGRYEAVLARPADDHAFFRVRETPPRRSEPPRP
jgi:hypothetical protein